MAENTREFVQQLSNISEALVAMVSVLEDKAADDGAASAKLVEVKANKAATVEMLDAIASVKRDTRKLRNKTEEIHEAIVGMRKQREDKSMLGNLVQPKNKKTLQDSVGSIVLIAGGIVAIGAAFKLVGDVDFVSVMALSLSLPLIAHSFAKIAEIKGLSLRTVGLTALAVVGMSAAIAAASWVLQLVAPITISQGLTAIAIAGTMAVASYAVRTLVGTMEKLSLKNLLLASSAMPLMAAGIVASSYFLAQTQTIGLAQGLSAVAVAGVLSVASVGMAMLLKGLKGATLPQLVFAGLAMPIMAAGLVASALVLSQFPSVDIPVVPALATAGVMGATALLLGLPIAAMSKLNISPKDLAVGIVGIVGMMGALAAGSHLISLGNYTKAPSLAWSSGVGLSLIAFTPAVAALGLVSMVNPLAVVLGIASIVGLGGALAAVSRLVSLGDYSNGPSVAWASAFALSMVAMVPAVVVLGVPGMQIIAALGVASMLILAGGLVKVADIVRGGNYSGGPSVAWAAGIGFSLVSFGAALTSVSPGVLGRIMGESTESRTAQLVMLAGSMKHIADIVRGGNYTGGPSKEWAESIGTVTLSMAKAIAALDDEVDMDDIDGWLAALDKIVRKSVTLSSYLGGADATAGAKNVAEMARSYDTLSRSLFSLRKAGDGLDDMARSYDKLAGSLAALRKTGVELDGMTRSYDELARSLGGLRASGGELANMAKMYDNFSSATLGITKSLKSSSALKQVDAMALAYNSFSSAVQSLARSLKAFTSLKQLPDMRALTASMVTLSVIDAEKLQAVMDVIGKRTDAVQSMYEGAQAAQSAGALRAAPAASSGGGYWSSLLGFGGGEQAPVSTPISRLAPEPEREAPRSSGGAQMITGPITVVNTGMERSLGSIDQKMSSLVSSVAELLTEARRPREHAPFGK